MSKKVNFRAKPQPPTTASADQWVTPPTGDDEEPMKRLTIDIPKSLHTHIKSQCALRGVKMVEEIRNLLATHFKKQ